ncbi:MAG: TraR/DksA family transcriptional regulator [Planctomycetota bacterium]
MGQKGTKNNGLTAAEIRKFRDLLIAKRMEILGNVVCMEDETLRRPSTDLSNMPFHMADMATDNYEMENTLGLMDSERKLLVEIDDALGRISNGTYGICEGSGEPIPKERLKAIPWARYCVAYARLLEKGFVRLGEQLGNSDHDYVTGGEADEDSEQSGWRVEKL